MKKINQLLNSLALLAIAALLCCCTDDKEPFERPGGEKEKSLTFSVRIPVPAVPKTYALNEAQENEVKNIDILLFNSSGSYSGLALSGSAITTTGTNGNVKTFNVKVPEGTYNMVILANCHNILSSVAITSGESKTSVLNKLSLSNTGKWDANTASGAYMAIPMWGEIANIVVNSTTTATSNAVNLVRMLSKIDVNVDTSLRTNFKLNSIRLYNYYDKGSVAPLASNWNNTDGKVISPSVLGSKNTGPLVYGTTTANISCIGEIYTFEAAKGTATTHATNTCLVIGGKYGTDTNETFYRVDFYSTSSTTPNYLPLLRNHSYKVNINKISNSGYATAAEALAARSVNIEAAITVWNDAKITKMAYDDQYILGVSDDDITFTREVRTTVNTDNILSVTTDVPGGWKVDKILDAANNDINTATNPTTGWLSLNTASGAANATTDRQLILKENTSGSPRVGYIHLVAGTLTYIVKVTQTVDAALKLTITNSSNVEITDLFFIAKAGVLPTAQAINLNWMPVTQTVSVSTTQVGTSAFVYATGSATPGTGTGTSYSHPSGAVSLSIQPTVFAPTATNPFEERNSKVDFTINNGMNYISKSVYFKQMAYGLVVDQLTSFYRLDGSTYTLNVRSNANWKIKEVTEYRESGTGSLLNLAPTDNLRITTTGGVNTGTGTPITFRVASNTSNPNLKGTLKIVFESTDSPIRFDNVELTLTLSDGFYPAMHKGWAGSNIYWDATNKMTFDDVNDQSHSHYQGLQFQWGSLWGISPRDVWTMGTIIYSPTGASGSAGSLGYSSWNTMPRVSDATNIADNRNRAYLYEITNQHTGIGDICKHITDRNGGLLHGKKWRMPTSQEFETAASYSPWTSSGSTTSTNAAGTNTIATGRTKTGVGTPFFPASGNRLTDGLVSSLIDDGHYWSSSPDGNEGYCLDFFNALVIIGAVNPASDKPRANGFSVRCVAE